MSVLDVEDDHLGARRVLPPDLTTPAKASKPRMKLTGPRRSRRPTIFSLLERRVERLEPAPEPNLKSIASVLARSMMLDMESSTEFDEAGRALGMGFHADVEPDGELKLIFCVTSRWVSSAWKARRSSSVAK